MSVLIFEASAVGFFEADRLSKHFEDEGTNRDAWDHHKARRFLSGGRLLLYGYMAEKWWAVQSLWSKWWVLSPRIGVEDSKKYGRPLEALGGPCKTLGSTWGTLEELRNPF
ncbi:hypothetical protein POM88_023880 [Heracleum sosnowskyi]|uniref:XS domain-containing protein n=1 Tax=Heracleum sosnowskyi TaxID=360622 RepID=A0AAD8MQU4_9APIA|nr:hypothetical protein POM88_023880 [Heracleum sosnowskyi]